MDKIQAGGLEYLKNEIKIVSKKLNYPLCAMRVTTKILENSVITTDLIKGIEDIIDSYIERDRYDIAEDFLVILEILTKMEFDPFSTKQETVGKSECSNCLF